MPGTHQKEKTRIEKKKFISSSVQMPLQKFSAQASAAVDAWVLVEPNEE